VSGAAYYVCPRCGRPIDWVERRVLRRKGKDGKVYEHVYFYAAHVSVVNGKRKIEKCYLGPAEYTYASGLHAALGLQLKGLIGEVVEGRPRIIDYLDSIARAIEDKMANVQMSAYTAQQLADRLQGLADRLRQYAEERARAEKKAEAAHDAKAEEAP
jgi:hypothetical protein